jgi:ubiquinone/menaquinone biosynthesis C-methylase UbiE
MYGERFADDDPFRVTMWQILCRDYFQRWIEPLATVVEVAAGRCEFINAIEAGHRIAVDLNPDMANHAEPGVEAHLAASTDMSMIPDHRADVVFVSNFFEHLPRPDILETLREIRRVLAPTGRLLVLQPNIRYCERDYWMFFDHITALDHHSLAEALGICGFVVEHQVVRFLPFTTKRRVPKSPWLVRLYLKLPVLWRVFGQQTFVVARPAD